MKMRKKDKKFLPTRVYVILFQIISLLPLPYIMLSTSSHSIYDGKGIFGVLCSLGISSLPRAEALGISCVYRLVLSELAVYFMLLVAALILGVAVKKLISVSDKCAKITLTALSVLIFADIIIRFIPFRFNKIYGPVFWAVSVLIRAVFLILVLSDLLKLMKKAKDTEESETEPLPNADAVAEEPDDETDGAATDTEPEPDDETDD